MKKISMYNNSIDNRLQSVKVNSTYYYQLNNSINNVIHSIRMGLA